MTYILVSLFFLFFIGVILYWNFTRPRNFNDELQKNCLITRYPILFLSGKRSLFYFYNYWNQIPNILTEHGYNVIQLNLSWRNPKYRVQQLKSFLLAAETENLKVHIVGDRSTEKELTWLKSLNHPSIQSVWEVCSGRQKKISKMDLYPDWSSNNSLAKYYVEPVKDLKNSKWIWNFPITLHNWFLYPEKGLEPEAVGVPQLTDPESVKKEYLKFAISLAEMDMKCSH